MWQDGVATEIGSGYPVAINDRGDVIWEQPDTSEAGSHAFLSRDGTTIDLGGGTPGVGVSLAAVGISSDSTTALVSSAQGSFIYTQAAAQTAAFCYVPYVEDRPLPIAKRMIQSTHCRAGSLTRINGAPIGSARVVSETPKPGDRPPKDSKVNLSISKSRNR